MKKEVFLAISLLFITFFINIISAASMPLYVKPLSGDGSLNPNTAYTYTFNWTTDSSCNNVIFSNSSLTITTGNDGIGFINLNIPDNLTSIPNYLCEYRNGALRKVHTLSTQFFNKVYITDLNVTGKINTQGNITASYFTGDGSQLTGISSVPAGAIMAFNSETCPNGWIACDGNSGTPDLRGIFVRGAGTNSQLSMANGSAFSATFGTYQNDSFQGHWHNIYRYGTPGSGSLYAYDGAATTTKTQTNIAGGYTVEDPISDGTNGEPRTGAETRPASYVLTYCMKTTEDSVTSNTIWGSSGDNIFVQNISKNVGIGTTSPTHKLNVIGDVNITGTYYGDGSGITGIVASSTAWNRSGSNVFLAVTGDNVGIGTTSPQATLDVDGAIRAIGSMNPASGSGIELHYTGGNSYVISYNRTGSVYLPLFLHASNITFGAAGSNRMFIDSLTGKVGIGTSSPDALLDIETNGADAVLRLHEDAGTHNSIFYSRVGGSDWKLTHDHTDSSWRFSREDVDYMTLDSSGNVGIGTTDPDDILHISKDGGTSATAPYFRIENTHTTIDAGETFGGILWESQDASTNGTGISGFINNTAVNAGVSSALTFGTRPVSGSANAIERVRIDEDGKVGIGTANPDTILHVYGTTVVPVKIETSSTSLGNGVEIQLFTLGPVENRGYLSIKNERRDSGGNLILFRARNDDGSYRTDIMTFDLSNDYVGIGTTSPNSKLEVSGNITLSSANNCIIFASGGKICSGS